jgi:hypothetical protein
MHNSINRAVIRMRDFLSQFNMTVVHCPGVWNNADAISRLEHSSLECKARDLNSSTTAKQEGQTLYISIGTCTSEDVSSEGQLKNIFTYEEQIPNVTALPVAKSLRTQATVCVSSCCLLCRSTGSAVFGENAHQETDWDICLTEPTTSSSVIIDHLPKDDETSGTKEELHSELSSLWALSTNLELHTLRRSGKVEYSIPIQSKTGVTTILGGSRIFAPSRSRKLG